MAVRLKYAQPFIVASTTNLQQFRGNSCFDPDFTGSGHQPHYFDQYALLYKRYLVSSCAIRVTATNNSNDAALIGIWPSNTTTTSILIPSDLLEAPYVKTRQLGGKNANNATMLSSSMATKKMRGLNVGNEDDLGAQVTTNPSRSWFWNVYALNFLAENVDISYTVVLHFTLKFYDRQDVAAS